MHVCICRSSSRQCVAHTHIIFVFVSVFVFVFVSVFADPLQRPCVAHTHTQSSSLLICELFNCVWVVYFKSSKSPFSVIEHKGFLVDQIFCGAENKEISCRFILQGFLQVSPCPSFYTSIIYNLASKSNNTMTA